MASPGLCYLCGAEATTRDHVPPKTLFPEPRPSNLITVPACEQCNKAYSRDEEYFRNNLVAVSNYENAAPVWETVRRSYKRRPAIHADLLSRSFPLHVGRVKLFGLKFDRTRTNRILQKIARGLVFHHYDRVLPATIPCETYLAETVPNGVRELLPKFPCRNRFGTTFSYIGGMAGDVPEAGTWLLVFYVSRVFVVSFGLDH